MRADFELAPRTRFARLIQIGRLSRAALISCLLVATGICAAETVKLNAQAAEQRLLASNSKKNPAPDRRTVNIGHTCKVRADCKNKSLACLKESDANGKELAEGICELPCAAIDAGMTDPQLETTTANVATAKKPPPPRCPKKFQCRSAGNGVPIDLCIKE